MPILIVDKPTSLQTLKEIAMKQFGNLVKAVVDVEKQIMAMGGELHADEEAELLSKGSTQEHLWGINLYPEKFNTDEFVEFDSVINLRPSQQNLTRGVENSDVQKAIKLVVSTLIMV